MASSAIRLQPRTFATEAEARAFIDEKNRESHNYVLFDDALAQIKTYEQPTGEGTPRGNIVFSQDEAGKNFTRSSRCSRTRTSRRCCTRPGHLWLEELHADAANGQRCARG